MKSQSRLLLYLSILSWGPGSLSSRTSDPVETPGPAELAVCFQAGLKASAILPGPIPCLNPRLGRCTGLWCEVRESCFLLVCWLPVLMHGVLLPHFNSLQLLVLTSQGWLFHFFMQYLCIFYPQCVSDDLLSLFVFHLHFSFLSGSC